MKGIPIDVFENYIDKDEYFILVKDPKHNNDVFHYTIWSIKDIKDIFELTPEIITRLDTFINDIKSKNYFKDEKMYFTYPPTHDRLHIHIVPYNYISYRPNEELYNCDDIHTSLKTINIINSINRDKQLSIKYELYYDVGVVVCKKPNIALDDIRKIEAFRHEHKLNFTIVIRNRFDNDLIEYLVTNYKFINEHIISDKSFEKAITYDKIMYI
jgi:hypothetical protein